MHKLGRFVVKFRTPILIIGILLLIPCVFGMMHTRINYDMLTYLPDSMDTVKGQNILKDDFGKGAFSLVVTEGMSDQEISDLSSQIEQVDHVATVLSTSSLTDAHIPTQAIPEKYYEKFSNGDAKLMAIFFDTSTSADETMNAITQIRSLAGSQVYISGMSAMVTDLKNLAEREEPIYVAIAVLCALIVLLVLTDSWLVPFIFLTSIGIAIVWNMGTNVFLGEISYITKALAAVLQLAVTMDYSIFLWHAFTEQREKFDNNNDAMAQAIGDTLVAIFSSALTACAGFLALCFMSYKLGADIGIVMAKGCALGLLGSITTLPALILLFEKGLEKTRHRTLIPSADRLCNVLSNHYWMLLVAFVVLLVPAIIGFTNKPVYYNFADSIASDTTRIDANDIRFLTANNKVQDDFDVATTEMVLCKSDLPHAEAKEMLDRIDDIEGVQYAVGYDSISGGLLPQSMLPSKVKTALKSGQYQLILINTSYEVASDEANAQVDQINDVVKQYDDTAMLIGEAPATKDLITTTNTDFTVVDWIAIAAILLILILVFKSGSLAFILVAVIEFAITINLGIPFYTHSVMPFIAPIVISTIQLGSTVNYAILMTTRYRKERYEGKGKHDSITIAASTSLPSIVTSAVSFFAATFGVSLYTNVSLIGSLCGLMARGAIISMFSVLFILPAFFMLCDRIIVKTSKGFINKDAQNKIEANAEVTA